VSEGPNEILSLLDLEQIDENLFRGYSPPTTTARQVYGGQAIAQALVATQRTAPPDRLAHSLHAYFVLAGDPRKPIIFHVERVRDGKSFTTRRCVATQKGDAIFSIEVSFQIAESGFDHSAPMPDVPPPEGLPTTIALAERFSAFLPQSAKDQLEMKFPVDIRVVDPTIYLPQRKSAPASRQFIWFRAFGELPDDQATHQAVLAYLSDMTLLNTALIPHRRLIFDTDLQVASLDHALWFHRPFRADQWLLYAQDSPSASGARGLTHGLLYTKDGRLAASVAQEGLIRIRSVTV
jgi:acyl-CoA thioesterase-2